MLVTLKVKAQSLADIHLLHEVCLVGLKPPQACVWIWQVHQPTVRTYSACMSLEGHSKTSSPNHKASLGVPIATCAKPEETLLLLKAQGHDNLPEGNNGWVLCREACLILGC